MPYVHRYNSSGHFENVELPFHVKLNFSKLFDFWETMAASKVPEEAERGKSVLKRLEKIDELKQPFSDTSILEKYEKEVRLLFSPMFFPLTTLNEIKAVAMPFEPIFFNMSKRMETLVSSAGGASDVIMRINDKNSLYIQSSMFVLNFKYGAGINYSKSMYFDVPNKKTGVMHHYRAFFNADFSEFKAKPSFKELTAEDIAELKNNFNDIELWKSKIPPGSFDYEGFGLITLFDVTREEAVSALKVDLLKKDALLSPAIIKRLEKNINSLLNIPGLKLGFAAYDSDRSMLKPLKYGFWNSILLSDQHCAKINDAFCQKSHDLVFKNKEPIAIHAYEQEHIQYSPLIKKLADNNIKSYIAVPLIYDEKMVGILELGSENDNELNSVIVNMLEEIIPLVTTSMSRSLEEHETQLESIIQEHCTAIHSSVEWRFFEAAENMLEKQNYSEDTEMEDIVFPDVYPLYGQSDIKGSSTARNESIQEDMIEQLTEARNVLEMAIENSPLPIYQELKFRINKYINKMQKGLGAGDEISILEFLKRAIYPVFKHLKTLDGNAKQAIESYTSKLDKDLKVVYKKRKDYEDSVGLINETMSKYTDKAQEAAQSMFPHYFEKYKTDGVEHNIYIGQSMVANREYNPVYLQNLRLWQLMLLCEIENEVYRLKPKLKVPLGICSLILVHSNPLTIRFRKEEKRFDVDGAYNVRYEIIKKRIDKAYIKGSEVRLTQPGKIAIVYSQDREAREYLPYLEYLQSIKYIGPEIENLDLHDMQGVTGMKALRVSVVFQKETKGVKASKAIELVKGL